MAIQPGLGQTWSETPKTGFSGCGSFVPQRLILSFFQLEELNKPKDAKKKEADELNLLFKPVQQAVGKG